VRIGWTVLEPYRYVRPVGGRYEVLARTIERTTAILLVSGEYRRDLKIVERSGFFEGFERQQHHDVAAFHVSDARTSSRIAPHSLETLKRRVALENRVEMPNEQDLPAAPVAAPFGNEMTGPLPVGAVHPSSRETETLKLGRQNVGHCANAGEVVRAAVDVHRALDQGDGITSTIVDRGNNPAFSGTEALRRQEQD
jgi:hypothetical protein